ncbi:MAG: hypothetical protein ACKPH1_03530 [Microcystis panniformis]
MRKNKLTVILLVLIALLTACSANRLSSVTSTADSTSTSDISTSAPASTSSFTEPDPETFVALMPALREYFYYRKQAVITSNIEELWTHFPELKNEVSIEQGINIVTNYQSLKPFDGNIFPEHYERLRVKFTNGKVEVLVHGMELYTWLDENNKFEDSGGEFKIVLYLHMKDGHWVVYKTDEVTLSEWKQFSP